MNFEALSRKLELGFFISNPYQALLHASLGGVLLQLVLCSATYGLLFHLAQRISLWGILRTGNPNHLGARAVRHVAPHLAFAAVVSLVLHVIHANQDAHALLLSKELAAVIGMVGLLKFFMWVLRDVMKETQAAGFANLKKNQEDLGLKVRALLEAKGLSFGEGSGKGDRKSVV